MNDTMERPLRKIPEVTLTFWIIKVLATTLGETGGDALSMTMHLGYAVSTLIFFAFFAIVAIWQVRAKTFQRFLYWAVIVATTTVGTTMADFADRSLGIGYVGGSLILFTALLLVLGLWWLSVGSVSVLDIHTPKVECFYWVTILFSNTLGTALGDFLADTSGLGYGGGALVFSVALLGLAVLYFQTTLSRTFLFWAAFILTRPLGATVGDLLTKPFANGGLHFSRITSSLLLVGCMLTCILLFTSTHPGRHPEAVRANDGRSNA